MARKRSKQTYRSDDNDEYEPIYGERRRPRRLLRKLVYFAIGLAIVIGALPTIIANTPLRNTLVAMAVPKGSVQVSIGGASLGWFSAPSLSGIEVKDAAGKTLLTVESVRVGRTPLALASNPHDLGEIEIVKPVVYLSIRPDGSNLEDVAKQILANQSAQPASEGAASTGKPVEVALKLVDGTILAEEANTGRRWRVQSLNVQYDSRGAAGGLGQLALSGKLDAGADANAPVAAGGIAPGAPIPPGGFAVALVQGADGRQQLQWQAQAVTLSVAEPFLQRFMAGTQLGGTLSAQGNAAWTNAAPQPAGQQQIATFPQNIATSGTIQIEGLDATAPSLSGDRVRLTRIEMPWRLTAQPAGVAIEELQVRSDLCQMQARGILDPAVFSSTGVNAATLDAVGRHEVEVRGVLDLTKLAAMLPHALKIPGDATITSGSVQLAARSGPIDGGQQLVGTVQTAKLAGTRGGRPISWEQPVVANFDVRRQNGNLRLESLKCDSDFLKIDAAGTLQQLTASAEFDLNRLGTQLGQFTDLVSANLAGTGTAHLDFHLTGADQFAAAANADLAKLHMTLADGKAWDEPRLAIKADANGAFDPEKAKMVPTRVAAATIQVDADGDTLNGQLTAPVDLTAATPMYPASVRVTGNVARWLTRARPWFKPGDWQIDGQSDLTADVQATTQSVDVSNAKAVVSTLHAVSEGWNIQEPRIEVAGDAHWNGATGEIASQSLQVVSSTVALAAKDVRLRTGAPGAAQASGVAAFRADLARVGAWKTQTDPKAMYQPRGMITGNARFGQQGDRITGDLTVNGENLVLAQATPASGGILASTQAPNYQTIWQEPQLNLKGSASYEAAADRLALQQFQIQCNTIQATADGQIDKLSTTGDVNATGTVNYDLAQVTQLLKPYLGQAVQLAGRETGRFQVVGRMNPAAGVPAPATVGVAPVAPHWSRTLQARMEVPWQSANVYGLPIGGGKLAAALGDGMVRVDPLAIAVGEGRLTAAPNVRLDPEPMELTLPAGPVLTDVRISPEVSEAMLKYVAPVLAGATQSEGQFSLKLDGARVPLADTTKTDASGQLTVHSVRVTPGPTTKQWVDLAQQIESVVKRGNPAAAGQGQPVKLLTIQDQQVNFRVVNGRVYHQGLQMQFGDVAVTSEGSVGLDETLSLVLRVPIQDKWIENQKLLAGLKGQSLSIPVGGTLARPQMDQRAIAGLSQQMIQGAAQQAIGGELNKAFDKFLKPKQ